MNVDDLAFANLISQTCYGLCVWLTTVTYLIQHGNYHKEGIENDR